MLMDENPGTVDSVVCAGGGDAGLLGALLVKEFNPEIEVTVVDDFDEDPPKVGKSTFFFLRSALHDILGIDETRFISEVRPVWKASVWFQDWCGSTFHVPFDSPRYPVLDGHEATLESNYRYRKNKFRTLCCEMAEQGKTPFRYEGTSNDVAEYAHTSYHLPLDRFNSFLRDICRERGIDLVNDRITTVKTNNNAIERLESESQTYTADLYIDSSGFSRLLMSELDIEFNDFDFHLDSAIVGRHPIDMDEITSATMVTSGDNGWFWQIDTTSSRDIGYVYSSTHTSKEEAVAEYQAAYSDRRMDEDNLEHYEYRAGHYESGWVNNCVAIGTSLGFVEPLQSLGLSSNALLASDFAESLSLNLRRNTKELREQYNRAVDDSWEEIYHFLWMHYKYSEGETEFWDDMQNLHDWHPTGYKEYTKFGGSSMGRNQNRVENKWYFIGPSISFPVLHGLNVESEFYEKSDITIPDHIKELVENHYRSIPQQAADLLTYETYYDHHIDNKDSTPRVEW